MRHRHGPSKLNRTSSHRKAMLMNMSNSLIAHERISTTLTKAKALRRVVEPLITLGKRPSVANRRLAFSRLRDRHSVAKVFDELGPRYQERPGGYVRILKDGFRKGDNAPMALVELVGQPADGGGETSAAAPTVQETVAPQALPEPVVSPEEPAGRQETEAPSPPADAGAGQDQDRPDSQAGGEVAPQTPGQPSGGEAEGSQKP